MNSLHAFVIKSHNPDAGLLLLRFALGIVFLYHGWVKFGSPDQTVAYFNSIDLPAFWAYLMMLVETFGGIALILGIFTRYASVFLAADALVELVQAHFANGFSIANSGYEYVFVLLMGCIALHVSGAGMYSAWHKVLKKTHH